MKRTLQESSSSSRAHKLRNHNFSKNPWGNRWNHWFCNFFFIDTLIHLEITAVFVESLAMLSAGHFYLFHCGFGNKFQGISGGKTLWKPESTHGWMEWNFGNQNFWNMSEGGGNDVFPLTKCGAKGKESKLEASQPGLPNPTLVLWDLLGFHDLWHLMSRHNSPFDSPGCSVSWIPTPWNCRFLERWILSLQLWHATENLRWKAALFLMFCTKVYKSKPFAFSHAKYIVAIWPTDSVHVMRYWQFQIVIMDSLSSFQETVGFRNWNHMKASSEQLDFFSNVWD